MRSWAVLALAACSQSAKPPPAPITQRFSNNLDLLFMFDGTMNGDMQTVFAANFPGLVTALDAFPGGRPNLHIGVVTSTVNLGVALGPGCPSPSPENDGLLQNTPRVTSCSPPTGRFITDIKSSTGARITNYLGTLDAVFACIAQVGATGCAFGAPLEGIRRALDGSRVENDGFLRDDASLGVLILTDKDDCSSPDPSFFKLGSEAGPGVFRCTLFAYNCDQPISTSDPGTYTGCAPAVGSYMPTPAEYAEILHQLRPEQRVAVGLISGDAPLGPDHQWKFATGAVTTPFNESIALLPSCMATINGNPTIGDPGIRLAGFVDQFGSDGLWRTICQPDYSAAESAYGALLQNIMKPCLAGAIDPTDRDSTTPGVQPACTVAADQALPLCAMADATHPVAGASGCAYFVADDTCGTTTNLAVHTTEAYAWLAVTCVAAR